MTKKHPLEFSALKHNAIPFTEIKPDQFLPRLKEGIEKAKQEIAAIRDNTAAPDFENTILALETAGEDVDLASGIFYNLLHAHTNDEMQRLAQEIGPLLSAYGNDITLDEKLFDRILAVHENRKHLTLGTEEERLLENSYKNFVRNGSTLPPEKKQRLREIDAELSKLGPDYSDNVLKATNAFELWIDDEKDLSGLPAQAKEAAAQAAADHRQTDGKKGRWLFTLHAPSYVPFMQYADNRALREKMWRAYGARAFNDSFDNQKNVLSILRLRQERAQLLGYKDHAGFVLEKRMAENADNVFKFLDRLLKASHDHARSDVAEVNTFARSAGGPADLMPWDFSYYSEKLKQKKYEFDSEELRPYFPLERVEQGVFEHARRLYGLEFKESKEYPVYHPDVRTYEVVEGSTGRFIGLFYSDYFPRESKSGGAWSTSFMDQGLFKGEIRRPHVAIVCNFTKPTATAPSLLTLDEVLTLFHEFGHALHSLLSDCKYRSVAGTNVYWDFVELPSQIMENWAKEKESLDLFARHYESGSLMPADLATKVKESEKFLAGYFSLRQLTFALLDMQYHVTPVSQIGSVVEFEKKILRPLSVFPEVDGTNMSCSFSHIFAGGYSAGYYSYKWAEVLDADAFEYFLEEGLFNSDVASRFRNEILSRGGTEHPAELYRRFRGREPDPDALLRRDGLI